jgi:hypothetical protein
MRKCPTLTSLKLMELGTDWPYTHHIAQTSKDKTTNDAHRPTHPSMIMPTYTYRFARIQ